ncbi:hypothetical protein BUALT_Bualt15G0052100 [Buddleja alternifolia]|uniref:Serine carboxypeptidase-like 18 n=1 Tax=Buddleja alternifolia TaxID=168488 RepID=A0AAV6WND1_9LAMI|nr:hypothetical protein BUALT_Bualt15G0052100 [Buddleja alternifolia]
MKSLYYLLLFILHLIINHTTAASQSIITTLPGYNDTRPFKLETGSRPAKGPVGALAHGGPGCSGFSGLVYEIGPLAFDFATFDGSLPSLTINPYSWTKIANIIFIDSPVGTGFSYVATSQGYTSNDTESTKHNYAFLRKWLLNHPTFLKNRLYVVGDSYGGKITPMVALEIAKGVTDAKKDENEKVPYAHRMALISDEYYELAKSSCRGDYMSPDSNNVQCLYALRLIRECTNLVRNAHILEPNCLFISPKLDDLQWGQTFVIDDPIDLLLLSKREEPWCRDHNYVTSYVWANDETVQEALHIRKGTKQEWQRCNNSISYENDVESVFKYHQLLSEKGYQVLAYSGDHDMRIPYMSTLKWIPALNLTVDDQWRPWTVELYTERYKNNEAYFTFATVKAREEEVIQRQSTNLKNVLQ